MIGSVLPLGGAVVFFIARTIRRLDAADGVHSEHAASL